MDVRPCLNAEEMRAAFAPIWHYFGQLPPTAAGFWRQYRAFVGPAFLVSVGYMDPGNWGTDLQAGAAYRYDLLWVVAASSFMATTSTRTSERVAPQLRFPFCLFVSLIKLASSCRVSSGSLT